MPLEPDTKDNLNKIFKTAKKYIESSMTRVQHCYIHEMSTSKQKAYFAYMYCYSTRYGKPKAFRKNLYFSELRWYVGIYVDKSTL